MSDVSYGYGKTVDEDFDATIGKVTEALKGEGFGVLTEIDMTATLKKPLGVASRQYEVLGACNPPMAHKALSAELELGLLLPCNVIVYENDEGKTQVSVINPMEMFKVVNNPAMTEVADIVNGKLMRVVESL